MILHITGLPVCTAKQNDISQLRAEKILREREDQFEIKRRQQLSIIQEANSMHFCLYEDTEKENSKDNTAPSKFEFEEETRKRNLKSRTLSPSQQYQQTDFGQDLLYIQWGI